MPAFISLCPCVCTVVTSPWCMPPLILSVCMCMSQPPIKGYPPLQINNVYRDWQFRWHDLRPQHPRFKLFLWGEPQLGWGWWWWLWLRKWGQRGTQIYWCQASPGSWGDSVCHFYWVVTSQSILLRNRRTTGKKCDVKFSVWGKTRMLLLVKVTIGNHDQKSSYF